MESRATCVPTHAFELVEVAAAGVNFVDALFVAGTYQIKVPPPFTPGSELAGTVVAVGDGRWQRLEQEHALALLAVVVIDGEEVQRLR